MKQVKPLLLCGMMIVCSSSLWAQRETYNFNGGWILNDSLHVTLPRACNEDEAYRMDIHDLWGGRSLYTKTFRLPDSDMGKRVLIEFEGARQSADVWINGQKLGFNENGVMAFGFDLTPYINYAGENQLTVECNSSWDYVERATNTPYQWNSKNFNMNMGGLPHNVRLHVMGELYQTLPLYSHLGTTGTYIYATDYDVPRQRAVVHAESQVINSSSKPQKVHLEVEIINADGNTISKYAGPDCSIAAGDTAILKASRQVKNLQFWSWGFGYLYQVKTRLICQGKNVDEVTTRTGFRKTQFGEGKIYLNDRCLMVHGYAQRSSNEWPGVGIDMPAWLSDYSNDLCVQSGGNVVRWMHVTPSKQEVESCDRVGLIQAMPAGDAEKDAKGRQWEQRTALMRDAIIYNRNNPSIIFYESGNESISREHMIEMVAIRDQYDPFGGRAIGSREMLDIQEAEYGGEMLYTNKSGLHPVWAMEYCRDEAYRMYWDNDSYPYHQSGAGGYYKRVKAADYNRCQEDFCIELIRRWDDYYQIRPGMGRRVSSGGVKIIFSDTNTHGRSEFNYRVSGVVDPMRIPKEAFYTHQVMWGNSWVEVMHHNTHIIGHWNHIDGVVRNVYVCSTEPEVELFLNGQSLGRSTKAEYTFLHTFPNITWTPGELYAVGYDAKGNQVSEHRIETTGKADHLVLSLIENPEGMKADGNDVALVQVEVMDQNGRRCPLDNRFVHWTVEGPCEWLGGVAKSQDQDNFARSQHLPVEAGVNRVMLRSTTQAGVIRLTARAQGLKPVSIEMRSEPVKEVAMGLNKLLPQQTLPCILTLGPTPQGASYQDHMVTREIVSAEGGASKNSDVAYSWDDNELTEWRNDGKLSSAWITYHLAEKASVSDIDIKLTGWRNRSYPLSIYADDSLVWQGNTPKSLGYVRLHLNTPVTAQRFTIRQTGSSKEGEGFGQIIELADPNVATKKPVDLDLYRQPDADKVRGELRIVEIDFLFREKND